VACFVKAYGAVFLGSARSTAARDAHEAPFSTVAPMALLAVLCFVIGLFPILVFPLLDHVLATWPGLDGQRLEGFVPPGWITMLGGSLVAVIAAVVVLLRRPSALGRRREMLTWDCGYARPRATMQYTSS